MGVATHICQLCGLKVRIWTDADPFYCRDCEEKIVKRPVELLLYCNEDDDPEPGIYDGGGGG